MEHKWKIGIVGSRRRNSPEDYGKVCNIFWNYLDEMDIDLENVAIVSGGCPEGADRFAKDIYHFYQYAAEGFEYKEFPPVLPENYHMLSGLERKWAFTKAAAKRNKEIAKESNVLIACVHPDRTGGTENTIEWFKKLHNGTRKLILC